MLFLILSAFAGSVIGLAAFYDQGVAAALAGMAGGGALSIVLAGGYLVHKTARARSRAPSRPGTVADNSRS